MTHEELAMAKRANLIVLAKKAEAILGVAPRAPAPRGDNEDPNDMVDLTGKKKKKAVPVPPLGYSESQNCCQC
jgi:hypothetical protein